MTAEIVLDYGPPVPSGGRCDECYSEDVVLKTMYRTSWSTWESGVTTVGAKLQCTNCGRKAVSYWGAY